MIKSTDAGGSAVQVGAQSVYSQCITNHPRIIAVLGGTGNEGQGLALRFAAAGHRVIIGSRDAEKARTAAQQLNGRLERSLLEGSDNQAAVKAADVIILTVPYSVQRTTVEQVSAALGGKILIDATVPLKPPKVSRVQLPEAGSAVAAIQRMLGESVRVVSAFQNVSAHHLQDLDHAVDCDVLVCGDDVNAREVVVGLCGDIGMRGLHAGPIDNSAAAEALTSILISINSRYKSAGAGIRITNLPD
ncbi:NADPH-dependent F420 reductase [Noviherbaspirillum sedimenti]|uniref:NADPH-dependent F420 reductase n=1 Tax=Noviherbaspirillum sedimenti TaxID=2320865 RepID=A0A3A3G3L0_9BURK|nr:NADPH-dependent F420 reductase [Noviherbaspirillum sedimenti]RJG03083.1 NADPH-dependent F420 reductase [Noviherbaspirillum sedimenti]